MFIAAIHPEQFPILPVYLQDHALTARSVANLLGKFECLYLSAVCAEQH
jgi:hypothetical protein